MKKWFFLTMTCTAIIFPLNLLNAEERPKSPAEGYNIHVTAPHRHEDGTVHGPYHHYCSRSSPKSCNA
jgi:hypothetical protein